MQINTTNNLNRCANNVITFIDNSELNYDFVAIQEAAKWEEIYNNSQKLNGMGYVHHLNGPSHLVTFFNKNKYKLIAVNCGYIRDRGRPYHILYLQNNTSKEFYIFINLHNAHHLSQNDLENSLSQNFDNFKDVTGNTQVKNAEGIKIKIDIKWDETKYNVIVVGDFNDHGMFSYWKKLTPFKYSNKKNIQNIEVKAPKTPPNTCCNNYTIDKQNYDNANYLPGFGDYILINSNLQIIKETYIPTEQLLFPSSDHLLVIIELQPTSTQNLFSKYILAFDVDETLCAAYRLRNLSKTPDDIKFRENIINNMKKVIESGNYIWIVTANNYTRPEFIQYYLEKEEDKNLFSYSPFFHLMNLYTIPEEYENARKQFPTELPDIIDFTPIPGDSRIQRDGLKPYAIYGRSLIEQSKYIQKPNFKIYLFDDNLVYKNNSDKFGITFIHVNDFINPSKANLLDNFNNILTQLALPVNNKYLTYKNNFNQSKYYEKYLKYKLKYNQLKEKFN